nr:hypothetical protein 1 [Desulfobacterales bacterium]
MQEVADYAPEGAKRLRALPSTGVRRGRDIDLVYQNIIAKYPRWQTPPTRERDYADPWLIATASVKHFQILTDESPAAVQSRSRAGLPKIPDVAPDYLVAPKVGLRQFAKERGWLPT